MQKTAVVIEDDIDIRGLIRVILVSAGFEVQTAQTAAAGVEEVRRHRPDLIVVDFGLPDFTGIEAIERIRRFSLTPVLMLTGHQDLADAPFAAGANDVMAKPFTPPDLRSRVDKLLRNHTATTAPGTASA